MIAQYGYAFTIIWVTGIALILLSLLQHSNERGKRLAITGFMLVFLAALLALMETLA